VLDEASRARHASLPGHRALGCKGNSPCLRGKGRSAAGGRILRSNLVEDQLLGMMVPYSLWKAKSPGFPRACQGDRWDFLSPEHSQDGPDSLGPTLFWAWKQ
jgi:hypothetical protein